MAENQGHIQETDKVTRKVILLHICEQLDNLSRQELMQIALETMYMDYFQFSALLDDLIREKLLVAAVRKNEQSQINSAPPERFSLTAKGQSILSTLRKTIPVPVSAYLHRSLQEKSHTLKEENSVRASWRILPNGHYEVSLSLFEQGSRYYHCEMDVAGEEAAAKLCTRWKKEAARLYPELLNLLLQ